jgi:hypothetical protein
MACVASVPCGVFRLNLYHATATVTVIPCCVALFLNLLYRLAVHHAAHLLKLDAAGYKALIKDIQSACVAGSLSPPTLCRLGFHSVHIAASVGKGRGANGGFHAWPVDYAHPSNGGLGDDISYLLEVG